MNNLTRRLKRLEAIARSKRDDGFCFWRRIIYDPEQWAVGQEEAIALMQTEELNRLVASGEIKEADRDRVSWIIRTIVYPPTASRRRKRSSTSAVCVSISPTEN